MTANAFPLTPRYIPVASSTTSTSTFRLEVQALGKGHEPDMTQLYKLECTRNNQIWLMRVTHWMDNDYIVKVDPPNPMQAFTYKQYQRTNAVDIEFKEPSYYLNKGLSVASFFIGAEVTVIEDSSAAVSTSPWNFTSSEQMQNWDVVLCVGETKFYAHKQNLSFVSSTFQTTFNGEFREKNQQEVPVNVDGTSAEHFDQCIPALLEFIVELITLADYYNVKPLLEKCLRMLKDLPNVPKLDKLRIALKVNSSALKEEVVASFTGEDIRELFASDLQDQLDGASWQVVSLCPSMFKIDKLRIALKFNSTALDDEVIAALTKEDLQELLASDLKDQLGDARWQKLMKRALAL